MRLASEWVWEENVLCLHPIWSSIHSWQAKKRDRPLHKNTPTPLFLADCIHLAVSLQTNRNIQTTAACSHCTHEHKTCAGLHLKQRGTDTLKQSYRFVSVTKHSVSPEKNCIKLLLLIVPFPFTSLLFCLVWAESFYVLNKSCSPHFSFENCLNWSIT